MNNLEKEMVVLLKDLKENYGVIAIKAEFEAEASRMIELLRLKDVTSSVGLPLIMKIGGVEAITDIYNCLIIGVAGIVAPMAETPYALSKFLVVEVLLSVIVVTPVVASYNPPELIVREPKNTVGI